jgi:hypothetical protein
MERYLKSKVKLMEKLSAESEGSYINVCSDAVYSEL